MIDPQDGLTIILLVWAISVNIWNGHLRNELDKYKKLNKQFITLSKQLGDITKQLPKEKK
jgi:hypothetical protein